MKSHAQANVPGCCLEARRRGLLFTHYCKLAESFWQQVVLNIKSLWWMYTVQCIAQMWSMWLVFISAIVFIDNYSDYKNMLILWSNICALFSSQWTMWHIVPTLNESIIKFERFIVRQSLKIPYWDKTSYSWSHSITIECTPFTLLEAST